jgi:TolB-like protein
LAAFGLMAVAGAWWSGVGGLGPPGAHVKSLAVLPFENLTGDPTQEYFVDGVTDAVTTNLAQIRELTVTSCTSVMQYKQTVKPRAQLARELNVDAFVEGAVLGTGTLRPTASP